MVELQSRDDRLQQDNNGLRARLEENWGNNTRESGHPTPLVKQNKGKEPVLPGDSDAAVDDELSSSSSLLPDQPPPKINVEVESRKGPHAVPTAPSMACIPEHEEKPAESHDS